MIGEEAAQIRRGGEEPGLDSFISPNKVCRDSVYSKYTMT